VKLQIKTTFDFGKLASQMPKIIEKHTQRTARSSATGAREAIDKGLAPPLKKSTLEIRKKRGTGGSKPLYETGSLYRSIKGTSEGLQMNKYGIYHHRGFKTGELTLMEFQGEEYETSAASMIPKKKVPARPFIFPSKKTILKSFDAFRKDLRKALKK
tara:strand:- start:2076 stop:2546 length:471 start_codon:yes stop_codon:yes gene_type:complete